MAVDTSSKLSRSVLMLLLLLSVLLVAASATTEHEAEEKGREGGEPSESWTAWAKDKISGGFGLKKNQEDEEEEDATRKVEEAATTGRERGQEMIHGKSE